MNLILYFTFTCSFSYHSNKQYQNTTKSMQLLKVLLLAVFDPSDQAYPFQKSHPFSEINHIAKYKHRPEHVTLWQAQLG